MSISFMALCSAAKDSEERSSKNVGGDRCKMHVTALTFLLASALAIPHCEEVLMNAGFVELFS